MPNTATSSDGIEFVDGPKGPLDTNIKTCGITYNGSMYVLTGNPRCDGPGIANDQCNSLVYSLDGAKWVGLGTSIFDIFGTAASYANGRFVVTGSSSIFNSVAWSSDGINWNVANTPWLELGHTIVYSQTQSKWVVGGQPRATCTVAPCYGFAVSSDNCASWMAGPTQASQLRPFYGNPASSAFTKGLGIGRYPLRTNQEEEIWLAVGSLSAANSAGVSRTLSGPHTGWTEFFASDVQNILRACMCFKFFV
jgi:hypothetical protein